MLTVNAKTYMAAACLTVMTLAPSAKAGAINYIGGSGDTVYGVTSYGGGAQGVAKFIANNVTGINDILATPGGAYQLANPVVGNNIFQTPANLPTTFFSFQIGGGNGNGAFGSGYTVVTGPQIGWTLADSGPAGGSASYMISSWTANFVVGAGGFNGSLGSYLNISGILPAVGSADVASLVTQLSIGGAAFVIETPLILAAAGNGNTVASGGAGAIVQYGGGGTFRGLAIDNYGNFVLPAGTTITAITTVTAYADPASFQSLDIFLDPDLLAQTNGLPNFVLVSDFSAPEPAAYSLIGAGLGAIFLARRKLLNR